MQKVLVLSLVMLMGLGVTPVFGGMNPDAKLALDVQPHTFGRHCSPTYASAEDIQQSYQGVEYYNLIVVLQDFEAVRTVEFGIDFSGVNDYFFAGFVGCWDLQITEVDEGQFSCAMSSATCLDVDDLPSGHIGLGVGWIMLSGGAGEINITPTAGGQLAAIGCDLQRDPLAVLDPGYIGGFSPDATEPTTWSRIKALHQ